MPRQDSDTCPQCRASIGPTDPGGDSPLYCPRCGARLSAVPPDGPAPGRGLPASSPTARPGTPRRRPARWLALVAVPILAAVAWAALSPKQHPKSIVARPGPVAPDVAPVPAPAVVAATPVAPVPAPAPVAATPVAPVPAPAVVATAPATRPAEVPDGPAIPGMVPFGGDVAMVPVQAMVSRFQVYRGGAAGRSVMVALPALWTDAPPGIVLGPHFGSLARLVMEQAVLGAARDELGLAVRCLSLGESPPPGPPELSMLLVTPYRPGEEIRWSIRRGGFDGAVVVDAALAPGSLDPSAYPRFVAMAEAHGRGAFAEGLKKAGLEASPNAIHPASTVDGAVEGLLRTLSFPAQLAAIRSLHRAIRADGESPERLGGLARGYANLGSLTEFHWTASHKLFKARALLYAQRMAAREPRSPVPLWHRAYALALAGLHRDALADLEAAGQRPAPEEGPPAWVELIEAYCRFDTARLAAASAGPQGRLAHLLRFYTVENYVDGHRLTLDTAREALVAEPECLRLVDALCQVGGISNAHWATTYGAQSLAASLPVRLRAMEGLPAGVAQAVDRGGDGVALTDALKAAGAAALDPGEPSWAALGRLVKETRFVHAWRRVAFMRDNWGVPVGDELEAIRPLLAGHPYRGFVESFGLDQPEAIQALREVRRTYNPADYELAALPFIQSFTGFDPNATSQLMIQAARHGDEAYRDLQVIGRMLQNSAPARIPVPHRLRAVSPDCPEAVALLIEDHWDEAAPQAATWEARHATHPAVLAQLAIRYRKLGRRDDERRCLESYNRVAPSRWAFERLAAIHRDAGQIELWRATLEEFLTTPDDYTLDHAKVRVALAEHFLRLGQPEKAAGYAEAAATSGASWAMECAGQCNEAAGRLDRAESWFRAESERSTGAFMRWFLFCVRTGQGDRDNALRLAGSYLDSATGRLSADERHLAVLFYDLAGEPAQGAALLRLLPEPATATDGQPGVRLLRWTRRMFLARFADELGDAPARDAAWARVAGGDDPTAAGVAELFRAALDPARGAAFDLKAFEARAAGADALGQSYLYYFAGRFLERRGRIEEASRCWERSAAIVPDAALEPLLGINALRGRGLPVGRVPADPAVYLFRGGSRSEAGRPDLALKDFDEAVRLDPASPAARLARGDLHRREGRADAALGDFDEAIRLDPGRADSFNTRGGARRDRGDLDGALADFGRAIELAPEGPMAYAGRGITHLLKGEDGPARRDVERCIAMAPELGFGHAAMGLVVLAQGREEEAQRSFEKAVVLDPAVAPAIEKLREAVKRRRAPAASG